MCALQVDDQLLPQEFAHADGKANRDPRKPHDNKDNKGKVDLDLAYLGFVAAATAPPPLVPRNEERPTLSRSTTEHFADCLDELKDLFKEKGRKNSTCKHCVALANYLALKDGRISSLEDELAKTTVTLGKPDPQLLRPHRPRRPHYEGQDRPHHRHRGVRGPSGR